MQHLYILGTVFFTVLGQIIAKWRMTYYVDTLPSSLKEKAVFFFTTMIFDPYIIATYLCGLFASLFWLMAIGRLELSYAYPFTSLAFVLVMISSVVFFGEQLTIYKIAGSGLIILGIAIMYYKGA